MQRPRLHFDADARPPRYDRVLFQQALLIEEEHPTCAQVEGKFTEWWETQGRDEMHTQYLARDPDVMGEAGGGKLSSAKSISPSKSPTNGY